MESQRFHSATITAVPVFSATSTIVMTSLMPEKISRIMIGIGMPSSQRRMGICRSSKLIINGEIDNLFRVVQSLELSLGFPPRASALLPGPFWK